MNKPIATPRKNNRSLLRCPVCLEALEVATGLDFRCTACTRSYPQLGLYNDLFVNARSSLTYPSNLRHLYYSYDKLIELAPPPTSFWDKLLGRADFNRQWEQDLVALKETVRQAGCCERGRVEFMKDDENSPDYEHQRREVCVKARKIMHRVLAYMPSGQPGGRVLHVGCGGRCNDGIPIAYAAAGFENHGVDAVRSYVEEFLDYGHAQLANALALPYADACFDVVNYTDILEHLFDPLGGLVEAVRVLKPGGLLILDTPNRAYINRSSAMSYAEYFLGKVFPSTLRRRLITAKWDGETFFHTEFQGSELRLLLKEVGVSLLSQDNETFDPIELEGIGQRPSLLRQLTPTSSWFVLCRKPS